MWLLLVALFGFVVPNGLFVYWLVFEYVDLASTLSNHLAVAFMLDALLAVGLMSYVFAVRPIGPVRWPWFVVLSFLGGLGFSIPFYVWWNRRALSQTARTS